MLRPIEKLLLDRVFAALAKDMGMDNAKVVDSKRKSDRDFDVNVECTSDLCKFSLWLPKAAIRSLVDWTRPEVASMTDHPEMAMEGDWSGVRDTDEEKLWEIFRIHVSKVAL
jgi:hypothetical protein